jgi:hypothetical protein
MKTLMVKLPEHRTPVGQNNYDPKPKFDVRLCIKAKSWEADFS